MSDSSNNKSELDEYGVWIKTPPQDAAVNVEKNETDSTDEINLDDFNIEALEKNITAANDVTENSFEEKTEITEFNPDDLADTVDENELTQEETEVTEDSTEQPAAETDDDFSGLDGEIDIDSFMEESGEAAESTVPQEESAPVEEANAEIPDGEVDLDSFMSDNNSSPASSVPDGEVDLDSFMGDSSSSGDGDVDLSAFMGDDAPSFGDGDIDLDSFMGGESFTADKQEMQEIEETDPLDIDLEFDDENPFETNQENSDTSLDLNDFSDGDSAENFDSLFDSIQDENPDKRAAAENHHASTGTSTESEEIDLSDFGIDDESENLNPVIGDESANKVAAGPVDYEMTIDEEESDSDNETVVEDESSDDEDYEIDITKDDVEETQKQQATDLSSPDDDFDVDALFDNIEDESGNKAPLDSAAETKEQEVQENQGDKQEPMFQENIQVTPEDEFALDENSIQENEIEVSDTDEQDEIEIPETLDQDLAVPENEDEGDDFSLPDFDAPDETSENEFSADNFESMIENPVEEEIQVPVTEETAEDTTTEAFETETTEESSGEEEFSVDEFMGDEGFTDGGIGVTGPYNEDGTLIEKYIKHDEEESAESESEADEPSFEEPVIEENAIEEPVIDENAIEEPVIDENAIDESATEETTETTSGDDFNFETVTAADNNETSAFDDDSTTLDMETLNNIAADVVTDETSLEEPVLDENSLEEGETEDTVTEEPSLEEPVIEENTPEESAETASEDDFNFETVAAAENNETSAFDDDSTTLDMETLNNIAADVVTDETSFEEPPVVDEPDEEAFDSTGIISDDEMEKVFESDQDEIAAENNSEENSEDKTFVMEESSETSDEADESAGDNMEEKDLDVSAYIDKGPDYDMTGVSLTLDDFDKLSSQPVEETETQPIPDTFEEEAAFLTSDSEENDSDETDEEEKKIYSVFVKTSSTEKDEVEVEKSNVQTETPAESPAMEEPVIQEEDSEIEKENNMSDESEAILKQISSELANLRTEINGLKDEFETIKKNGISSSENENPAVEDQFTTEDSESQEIEDSTENSAKEEDTGFFADTDEDDTIALSGDELTNILNSADFAPAGEIGEQKEEEIDNGLSMNFEEENLEEPVFDETQESEAAAAEEEEEEEEEEIEVPTVDDVLVESADTDLMSSEIKDDNEEDVVEADSSIITDDDIPSPTLESILPETEPLTDGNMDFLTSDPAASMDFSDEAEDENEDEEDENLETGISEEPVEEVFNTWENNEKLQEPEAAETEEPVIAENAVAEEPVIEDSAAAEESKIAAEDSVAEEKTTETKTSSTSDIPENMKDEIRSVLAYMDQLLENLPEEKIEEFAQSEQFETYKKLFAELGLS